MARRENRASASRKIDIFVCVGLAALVWSVFGQTLAHDFVNYDDRTYLTQARQVNSGLTSSGVIWAFTHAHAENWHPLTTISHMLDCQLFGLRAGPHHAVNVFLHMCAVLLLYFVLRSVLAGSGDTRSRDHPSPLQCAFVAAVFAIHPLRVESVAWIAERKDVLSACFFMLTLIAYARYAKQPSRARYMTMSIFAACGLMSKPMLVTLPLVLLLLDYWPLHRNRKGEDGKLKLFLEKIPLFAMAFAVSAVTFVIQEHSPGAIAQLPLTWRIENAVVSYIIYIAQMFWPNDLIVFYPHPDDQLRAWQVLGAAAMLLAVSVAAFRFRLTKPYLFVGWLWYLVMLLPVIGIVEVGLQGHADRYTYLPQIGLGFAMTWLIVDLAQTWPRRRQVLGVTAAVVLLSLGGCAWHQTTFWRNSETLWLHALAVSPDNDVAHTNMANVLLERDRGNEAITHLQTALQIRRSNREEHYHVSLALIYTTLGAAFAQRGDFEEAANQIRTAISFEQNYPDAHYDVAVVLEQKGDVEGAIAEFGQTLGLRPDDVDAHVSLATAFTRQHRLRDAIAHFDTALKLAPRDAIAANNLAWILATTPDDSLRDGRRSVALAKTATSSEAGNAVFTRTLAAAYAESGQFDEARASAESALQKARANHDVDLANEVQIDLEIYARARPLRSGSLTNAP
jgi:tetratricopeptide (TPR) repeat protein